MCALLAILTLRELLTVQRDGARNQPLLTAISISRGSVLVWYRYKSDLEQEATTVIGASGEPLNPTAEVSR